MTIHYNTAIVVNNEKITEDIHKLTLVSKVKLNPYPGQFIMIDTIKNHNNYNHLGPILKRPFSFYRLLDDSTFEIMFRVKGDGTILLSEVEVNDELKFLGPLGKPIDIYGICGPDGSQTISLVGGGIGIVPLMFLAQGMNFMKYRRINVYLGFHTNDEFTKMCLRDFCRYTHFSNVVWAMDTERGNSYLKGTVVDLYKDLNTPTTNDDDIWVDGPIFVCGPEPMMEYFHNLTKDTKYPCYCFVERRMACGIGVCHSCNINGKTVCKDGPCLESKYIFE